MAEPQDFTVSYFNPVSQKGTSVILRRWLWMPDSEHPDLQASRMRIEVITTYHNVPKELFVWERHTVYTEGVSAENKDRILCVAKTSDLSVYPITNPDTRGTIPPFYRTDFFDVPYSAPEDLWTSWDYVKQDVQSLLKALIELEMIDVSGS